MHASEGEYFTRGEKERKQDGLWLLHLLGVWEREAVGVLRCCVCALALLSCVFFFLVFVL